MGVLSVVALGESTLVRFGIRGAPSCEFPQCPLLATLEIYISEIVELILSRATKVESLSVLASQKMTLDTPKER